MVWVCYLSLEAGVLIVALLRRFVGVYLYAGLLNCL